MATAQIPWNDGSGHDISVEWDGTQDGEIKISSPTNPSLTAQRTKSIQVRTTAGSPQLTRTINVVQEAAVYTYEYSVTASSSATLAASGGSVTYTAQLKTYLQGDLLKTETVTPTCRIISGTGFSASGNKVAAASRGTEYSSSERSAQVAVEFEALETGEILSETVTVTQAENNRVTVYGKPNITDVSVNDIPASGGSISSATISYSQSRHYYYDSGATEELSALTTGGTVNYGAAVTAASLGTTVKNREIIGTLTFTVSMNGQTSVEDNVSIYQAKNVPIAIEVTTHNYSYPTGEISAGGGTKAPIASSGVTTTFSSGATKADISGDKGGYTLSPVVSYSMVAATGFNINVSNGVITAADRTTVEGAARSCGNTSRKVVWTCIIDSTYGGGILTAENTKTLTAPVSQEANVKIAGSISYGAWQVSVSANRYTTTSSPCPAGGGTCTISASASRTRVQNYSYTSGSTSTETLSNESGTPTLSVSGTGANLSGTTVTWEDRDTIIGDVRQATVTAEMDDVTAEVVIYQEENEITGEYLVDNDGTINLYNDDTDKYFENPTNIELSSDYWPGNCTYGIGLEFTSGSKYQPASYSEVQQKYSEWLADIESNIDDVFGFVGDGVVCVDEYGPDMSTPAHGSGKFAAYRDCGVIENTGSIARTGYFQWKWSHISIFTTPKVTVSQEAGAYLNVSPTSLSFEASGGTKTITIDTNESWTIE